MLPLPAESLSDSSISKKVVLVLFHNDLRINDNATLQRAAALAQRSQGRLLPVYASDLANANQQNWGKAYHYEEMGLARQQFLQQSLADLNEALQRLGNQLLVLPKPSIDALSQLITSAQVSDICVSQSADYRQNQAYIQLQQQYPKINWHYQQTATLFPSLPMTELPKSFTQFRKQIELHQHLLNDDNDLIISAPPQSLPPLPDVVIDNNGCDYNYSYEYSYQPKGFDMKAQDTQAHNIQTLQEQRFNGGEHRAMSHLDDYFNSKAPSTYKTTRNALEPPRLYRRLIYLSQAAMPDRVKLS